jgi:hypothetical protein
LDWFISSFHNYKKQPFLEASLFLNAKQIKRRICPGKKGLQCYEKQRVARSLLECAENEEPASMQLVKD